MAVFRLADLAQQLAVELVGDGQIEIKRIASMAYAAAGDITFLSNSQYQKQLANCQASAVILTSADLAYWQGAALVAKDPYLTYAKLAQLLDSTPKPATAIAATAVIAEDVVLGANVTIGANAVIESGVVLADNVSIGAGCFIGQRSQIGAHSKIWANVSIYHDITIGQHCLIQSNTVIGGDGFGYANDQGKWVKIPQLGTVKIGDYVEIGACTTIDRGALDNTIVGNGVIIDNQCQIAHNVIIGDHTAIAGGVILAGSLTIGRHCMIGGASVINGHMSICDKVVVTGMSMVIRPIDKPGVYSSGIPAQPNKAWRKTAVLTLNINEMNTRLQALERRMQQDNKN